MVVPANLSRLLEKHVSLDVRGIDRSYLNAYQPLRQIEGSVWNFFCKHRGQTFASSALMGPLTEAFVKSIEAFAKAEGVDVIEFRKGQRKDDIAKIFRRNFPKRQGVVFIGKAQEKTSAFRTYQKKNATTGTTYPRLYRTAVYCNQYYFYSEDEDFGPPFIKFSSYFPYTGRVCLNGHEYAKRQLAKEGIAFEELDNGCLSCANPERLQQILDGLSAAKLAAVFRKWLARLPRGFSNRMLRDKVALLLGRAPTEYGPGRMTYDLRRLKLHGLIDRIEATNRHQVTTEGVRIAIFFSKLHARLLRTACSDPLESMADGPDRRATKILHQLNDAVESLRQEAHMAA